VGETLLPRLALLPLGVVEQTLQGGDLLGEDAMSSLRGPELPLKATNRGRRLLELQHQLALQIRLSLLGICLYTPQRAGEAAFQAEAPPGTQHPQANHEIRSAGLDNVNPVLQGRPFSSAGCQQQRQLSNFQLLLGEKFSQIEDCTQLSFVVLLRSKGFVLHLNERPPCTKEVLHSP